MTKPSTLSSIISELSGRNGTLCRYGTLSRHGGVSQGLYASLNVGQQLGDSGDAVLQNRRRVKEMMSVPCLLSATQVHDTGIYCLTEPIAEDKRVEGYDALITDLPETGLLIQQADCQAVLFFDPVKEVIAAVHCGWRGSVQKILTRVISVMSENYGTDPAHLRAVISPSLGPCCAEFVNHKDELPVEFQRFMVRDNHFDFWQISTDQLVNAGMSRERIKTTGVCTCCSEDYFSYRRASRLHGGITGRNCSVISLQKAKVSRT